MTSIRTHRFANNQIAAAGTTTLFTVPAGHRAVVKWSSVVTQAPAGGICVLFVDAGSGNSGFLLYLAAIVQNQLYQQFEQYAVLEEGETLKFYIQSVTGGVAYVAAGGVLFEL